MTSRGRKRPAEEGDTSENDISTDPAVIEAMKSLIQGEFATYRDERADMVNIVKDKQRKLPAPKREKPAPAALPAGA